MTFRRIVLRPLSGLMFLVTSLASHQVSAEVDGIEGTEQLFGTWANVIVSGRFAKDSPWIYYGDVSLRTTEQGRPFPPEGQGYQVSSVITHDAIGYRFNASHSVHLGYAFAYAIPPLSREPTNENRVWEQHTFALPTSAGDLQLRSRLEQRTVNIGSGTAVRFREMVRFSHPLNKEWSLVGSNELFINANTVDWGPVAGFDQNRVFVGVGYKIDSSLRAEVGYMNQYINRDLNYDRDFHLLSLNLYVDVPN
ncbi:MAG: DUF2490 domain-containing protein [Methylococcaceae bacterium]|nr:DUF2490 domain-containing protein [Methylococcaceae bacterium]